MPIRIILNIYYAWPSNQPIFRYADEAMAEVEILELLQKNDKDRVANVVHMKEYFQFRDHLCISFDLMGWVWKTKASYPAHSCRNNKQDVCNW